MLVSTINADKPSGEQMSDSSIRGSTQRRNSPLLLPDKFPRPFSHPVENQPPMRGIDQINTPRCSVQEKYSSSVRYLSSDDVVPEKLEPKQFRGEVHSSTKFGMMMKVSPVA